MHSNKPDYHLFSNKNPNNLNKLSILTFLILPGASPVVPTQQPPLSPTPTPNEPPMDSQTTPPETPTNLILPSPLQNVEQFGSFLGEEIVANWRRSLERTIHSVMTSSPPADTTPPKPATPVAADSTEKSAASTPVPADLHPTPGPQASPQPCPLQLNGNPKSPEDNNNLHVSNNNMHPLNAAAMLSVNFLRNEDSLKGPYRFDDHRSPFRFADELTGIPGAMVGRLGESLIPKGDPMEARLQEMLRYNMDKYANQNLDTLHISRRVRELLSIHNIGQRLFAKYILGLSQGTVSELLSKPKPWDKLTEKGRDSYRKMHAWACDDNAVMMLKSLIPKKGELFYLPLYPFYY